MLLTEMRNSRFVMSQRLFMGSVVGMLNLKARKLNLKIT